MDDYKNALTSLNLSSNGLDDDDIAKLLLGFNNNMTIQILNLSNNSLLYNGVRKLLRHFRHRPTLTALDISNNLPYYRNNLQADDMNVTADLLTSFLTINQGLKSLKIGCTGIGLYFPWLKSLKDNRGLTELDLSGNCYQDTETKGLVEGLKSNTTLTKLNLSKTFIGDAGARKLARVLIKSNTTLSFLDITGTQISKTGEEFLNVASVNNARLDAASQQRIDQAKKEGTTAFLLGTSKCAGNNSTLLQFSQSPIFERTLFKEILDFTTFSPALTIKNGM